MSNVEYKRLGNIAEISRGGSLQKSNFTETGYPCIHYGQIYTKYGMYANTTFSYISNDLALKQRKACPNDIVMAVTSENIEDVCKCVVWCGETDVAVSGHTAIIHCESAYTKYLAYYFQTNQFFAQKRKILHGTKVIEVTPVKLSDIVIPVPSIEVQHEIVSILDRFYSLCNDITIGLPAEIEARQKQYEYYRDKLLSFQEK